MSLDPPACCDQLLSPAQDHDTRGRGWSTYPSRLGWVLAAGLPHPRRSHDLNEVPATELPSTKLPASKGPVGDLDALKGWRRLHIRLTLLYGSVTLLALVVLGINVYRQGVRSEIKALQDRLLAMVVSLSASVDASAIQTLQADSTVRTDLHERQYRRFKAVGEDDQDIESIYLLKPTREPTKLRFVVDYVKDGDSAKPGEAYDASDLPIMLKGFSKPSVENKPYSDRFGTTLSGYAPVVSTTGKSVGLVGADVDASRLQEIRSQVIRNVAYSFGLASLLLAGVAALIARNLRGPLTRIIQASSEISQGKLTTRIGLDRNDELGVMSDHIDLMAEQLQEREFIRETFGRYLSDQIANELLKNGISTQLGGEERVVTILFCDLRSYSTISEQMSPTHVVKMLNQYLGAMTQILDDHHGCALEFIGDEVLGVFGAPHYIPDHSEQAVRAAIKMLECLRQLNEEWHAVGLAQEWEASGVKELTARIGIHSGAVVAGNLGSKVRMKYSVIGDTVNVAARLEDLNKALKTDIAFSREVYIQLPQDLQEISKERGKFQVKGRELPVRVYALE